METQVIPSGPVEVPKSIAGACLHAEESVAPEGEFDSAVEHKTSDGDAAPEGDVDSAVGHKTLDGDAAPQGDVDSATGSKTSDGDAAPVADVDSATGPKTSYGDAVPAGDVDSATRPKTSNGDAAPVGPEVDSATGAGSMDTEAAQSHYRVMHYKIHARQWCVMFARVCIACMYRCNIF